MIFDHLKKLFLGKKVVPLSPEPTPKKQSTPAVIKAVQAESLTYVGSRALKELYERILALEEKGMPGILIEAGCALGGSAIVMASAKSKTRSLNVYDVFAMIPPPSERDGEDVQQRYEVIKSGKSQGLGEGKYYGYEENLLEKVQGNFSRHGVPVEANEVHLIKGLFEDTLQVNGPVALAHIDGDWYQSVKVCLERIAPHLVPGGALVIDDYAAYSGCAQAVDEYFADKQDQFEFVQLTRLHIVKKG